MNGIPGSYAHNLQLGQITLHALARCKQMVKEFHTYLLVFLGIIPQLTHAANLLHGFKFSSQLVRGISWPLKTRFLLINARHARLVFVLRHPVVTHFIHVTDPCPPVAESLPLL